jgi:hypothetical protein
VGVRAGGEGCSPTSWVGMRGLQPGGGGAAVLLSRAGWWPALAWRREWAWMIKDGRWRLGGTEADDGGEGRGKSAAGGGTSSAPRSPP